MTPASPTRKLTREFLYLLVGIFVGLLFVPAIGSVYYHEDIGIGYRQFLGALLDPETSLTAVTFVLAPYLLAQLVRSAAWGWHRFGSSAKQA